MVYTLNKSIQELSAFLKDDEIPFLLDDILKTCIAYDRIKCKTCGRVVIRISGGGFSGVQKDSLVIDGRCKKFKEVVFVSY